MRIVYTNTIHTVHNLRTCQYKVQILQRWQAVLCCSVCTGGLRRGLELVFTIGCILLWLDILVSVVVRVLTIHLGTLRQGRFNILSRQDHL
jgi:hypothetical protein